MLYLVIFLVIVSFGILIYSVTRTIIIDLDFYPFIIISFGLCAITLALLAKVLYPKEYNKSKIEIYQEEINQYKDSINKVQYKKNIHIKELQLKKELFHLKDSLNKLKY